MLWALLIVAFISGFLAEIVCFLLRIRNFPVTVLIQFLASLSATYSLMRIGTPMGTDNTYLLFSCIGVSIAVVLLSMVLRRFMGSWYERRPGRGLK